MNDEVQHRMSRDEVRRAIFGQKPASKMVTLAGCELELRQPVLGTILALREAESDGDSMIRMILDHLYIPGTQERVFDSADRDAIKSLPFGPDFAEIARSMTSMTGVNMDEAAKELETDPT